VAAAQAIDRLDQHEPEIERNADGEGRAKVPWGMHMGTAENFPGMAVPVVVVLMILVMIMIMCVIGHSCAL
jgi:hypothetical protein